MSNQVLEPVEGITVEQWASAQAKLASGGTVDDAIKMLGVDAPKWERVSAEWLARMQNDTDFKIMPIYSAAFTQKSSGDMGGSAEVNENTCTFEKYMEAQVAQTVLAKHGRDAQDVLKDFGMTPVDYSNVGMFWMSKMTTDWTLGTKMEALTKEYTAKYESMGGDSHSDLEF